MKANLKEIFTSGDFIAFAILTIIIIVLIAVFGVIDYPVISSEAQPIANIMYGSQLIDYIPCF